MHIFLGLGQSFSINFYLYCDFNIVVSRVASYLKKYNFKNHRKKNCYFSARVIHLFAIFIPSLSAFDCFTEKVSSCCCSTYFHIFFLSRFIIFIFFSLFECQTSSVNWRMVSRSVFIFLFFFLRSPSLLVVLFNATNYLYRNIINLHKIHIYIRIYPTF